MQSQYNEYGSEHLFFQSSDVNQSGDSSLSSDSEEYFPMTTEQSDFSSRIDNMAMGVTFNTEKCFLTNQGIKEERRCFTPSSSTGNPSALCPECLSGKPVSNT